MGLVRYVGFIAGLGVVDEADYRKNYQKIEPETEDDLNKVIHFAFLSA